MKPFITRSASMVALLGVLLPAASALADVPRLVHYQGKLVTSAGAIVTGPVGLRARLYDSPTNGSPVLFDETHAVVQLNRGLFSVLLGSQTGGGVPDSVLAGGTAYLGISVDGAAELAPRIRIATAPYAAKTRAAEQLVRPNTATTAVSVDAAGDVGIGGRLGIGTASPTPSASLHVSSTTGGFLPPSMTTAQRDAIAGPAPGLQIFNTDTKCYNMWDSTTWRQSCFECAFSPPTAGNNGPICEGQTLNLTATPVAGATYAWVGPNGFSSSDQSPSILNTTTAATGPYSVTATVNGCTSNPVTTLVSVGAIPSPPSAGNNGPICAGQTLDLTATTVAGATYGWTGPNGFVSSLEDPSIPNAPAAAGGAYQVQVTVNGCTSLAATTNATVNQTPAIPGTINGMSSVACSATGQVYSISDVPGATTYTWTVPSGASIAAGQGTAFLTVNFGTESGNITVTAGNVCGTSLPNTLAVTVVGCPLYAFTNHTFTNCGQGGRTGPSVAQCRSAYSTGWDENGAYFDVSGGIQLWTVPQTGTYRIETRGAQGGFNSPQSRAGGLGASMAGDFALTAGDVVRILVGQQGGSSSAGSPAGGGGAFVANAANVAMIVAGGGGGAGNYFDATLANASTSTSGDRGYQTDRPGPTNGEAPGGTGGNGGNAGRLTPGGGGFNTNGATTNADGGASIPGPGIAFINGGLGGTSATTSTCQGSWSEAPGGFGGGGGAGYAAAGAGGGYSGGGGTDGCQPGSGGGGGSFNAGSNQASSAGANSGQGSVIVTRL